MNPTHTQRLTRLSPLLLLPVLLASCYEGSSSDSANATEAVGTDTSPTDASGSVDPDAPPPAPTGGMPTAVECDETGAPDTIDCLYERIIDDGLQTVEEVIPLLPEDMRTALFLMEESRSRHQASREFPRVILYGDDSRLIFSMSTTPTDPLYETLELVELQDDGSFKFRQLDMDTDPPHLAEDDVACQGCHSPRPRLIWGQYRTWPGSYELGPSNTQAQLELQQRLPERFGSLIVKDYDASPPAWSVEVWNFQQNRLMMRHHAQLAKASSAYTLRMRYRLAGSACEGDYDATGDLMAELGLSPEDTRADLLFGEINASTDIDWYGGGGSVGEVLVDVAAIDLLYHDHDEELETIVAPYIDALSPMYSLSHEYYDAYEGLLPFDIPAELNGVSAGSDGGYNGYGGNYGGLRLRGYLGAFDRTPPLYSGLDHEDIKARYCDHIADQLASL